MAIIDVIQKKLNVQPDGIPTVVRLSQNENGRELVFDVENCEIPAGSTVTISGTKPDGNVYSLVGSITDNTVTFAEDIQMTAVGGQWDAKVVIVNGGNTVATGRVRMIIDPDTVDPDAVPSDSQLEGLVAQAQEYAEYAKGAAYGAPYVASTVAQMTDHDHVYVYTGSEAGYTAGNWYYWNGSAWTSGGVYNSVAVATDKTLAVSDMAADAKVTGDRLTELKSEINDIVDISGLGIVLEYREGFGINSSGRFFTSTKRIATQAYYNVSDSDTLYYSIEEGYRVYGAFYEDEDESDFVSNFGWLTGTGSIAIPEDGVYVRVALASVGDSSTVTLSDASKFKLSKSYALQQFVQTVNNYAYMYGKAAGTNFTTLEEVKKIGVYSISTNYRPTDSPDGFTSGTLIVLNAYTVRSLVNPYDTQLVQILIDVVNSGVWMRYCNASLVWRDWVHISFNIVEKTKWLALGDSITYGVYSTGINTKVDDTNGWVKRLADSLGYSLNNQGVRGMGYIAVGGNGITWDSVLDTVETYTASDYNLVTVHLGINDYNTSSVSLSDLETVVKDSIQRLATKFPNARLVFITPLNSNRRGDASTKYCYGQQYGGRSLKDIADKIKECCDAYGVECIYATDGFLLNTFNIATLLPDQTHPSNYCHTLIAKNMAHLLLN